MGALLGGAVVGVSGVRAATEGRDERAGAGSVGGSGDSAAIGATVVGTLLMGMAAEGMVENDATDGGADADDAGTDGDGVTVDMAFNVKVGASVEACGWINDTETVAAGMRVACITGLGGCVAGAAVAAALEGAAVCNAGAMVCDTIGLATDGVKPPGLGRAFFDGIFFFLDF